MRLARLIPHTCERVREQLSLALDGELSQLENAHLDAHLASCASCRTFGAELDAATRVIRSAPLEELSIPISIPSSRRIARRAFQTAAAAAVVLAAGIGSIDLANREAQRSASPAFPTHAASQVNDALQLDRSHPHSASGLRGRVPR
jgi:negative regulator of sigma E activity